MTQTTESTRLRWARLLSAQRYKTSPQGQIVPTSTPSTLEGVDALRTDFHIDYDRVVFSGAFRRLGRKTQVHPFAKNDHTHNRLTHSVEVASVGRSLGNRVGVMMRSGGFLPEANRASDIGAIVQVACLAHDLGNPPFGHTGEEALRAWFKDPAQRHYLTGLSDDQCADICTYEGNANSLRLVASTEMYRNRGGMRLSAATIGALLKYPWTSADPHGRGQKFNIYQTELDFIRTVAADLGLPELALNRWARHPLSYLMEAADDICYALLDLEDAVEIGLIEDLEFEKVLANVTSTERTWQAQSSRQRCAMLRGIAIGKAIDDVAQKFMMHQQELLNGTFVPKDLLSISSEPIQEALFQAKELARQKIYRHRTKLMTEIASFPCIGAILDALVPAAFAYVNGGELGVRNGMILELLEDEPLTPEDDLYMAYMKILDFVGGMTDNSAAQMARDLSGFGLGLD